MDDQAFKSILMQAKQRRRRFDELQRRLAEEEQQKAELALEERRRTRREADDRMRQPYHPPPGRHKASGGNNSTTAVTAKLGSGPQQRQQKQGRQQLLWGAGARQRQLEEEEAQRHAVSQQQRAARRTELRQYISMQRTLLQHGDAADEPSQQAAPLRWQVTGGRARWSGSRPGQLPALPPPLDEPRQLHYQQQHAIVSQYTDTMLRELGLLGPDSGRAAPGGGQQAVGTPAAAVERGPSPELPEPCRSTSPHLPRSHTVGASAEKEAGQSCFDEQRRRLFRLNSDLYASGGEGWEASAGMWLAAKEPMRAEAMAQSPPALRAEQACLPQQAPLPPAGGTQHSQLEWPPGPEGPPPPPAGLQWQLPAALPPPPQQDSAAEIAGAAEGQLSAGGSASASLLGSWGLGLEEQEDLPRFESDSESLRETAAAAPSSEHTAEGEQGLELGGCWSSFAAGEPEQQHSASEGCGGGFTSTATSSGTASRLEGLEQQVEALRRLQGDLAQQLGGLGAGSAPAMAGSESSLAAAEQPEVWCEVDLESVLAAEVAHLPGPAAAASASQGDAIPAASSDGSYPASGIAGDGASVPQQARSFLRQAYALISRLKGAPSAAQSKAAAEPQPQEQVAAAGAAAAAGALAPMQPPRPLPPQPLPAATLAAPTAAGREAQWQSSAQAGAGAFLQQVSNHLVEAGGHTELQAQGAQQQAAWALWQQDVMSQQRSRKPPGLAAPQLLQQQQQQHTWQAQAALAAGLYKLPAPGQQYEQQQAGAWLTSTQSPAGAPVSTTWAVPQLLRATAGGLAGAAARAPPRPPLLAAPPFDTRGYAALAGHGITSSSRGGSSRPIGSKAAPVAAKPEAPRTLEGSYVHAARLAKERAAREEAERQRLRQQGEVLKAAAKRRLKEQQEQGKQAQHPHLTPAAVPPGTYAAVRPAKLGLNASTAPAQPAAVAAAMLDIPAVPPVAASSLMDLWQGAVQAWASPQHPAPTQCAPAPAAAQAQLGGLKSQRQEQQQQGGGHAPLPPVAARAPGHHRRQVAQLLRLAADAQMLSQTEGLVRHSLDRLNEQLAAKGVGSSDLDAALNVTSRANSLMQQRLNKSIACLDSRLAGLGKPGNDLPQPVAPAGKPAAASPSKARQVRPVAAPAAGQQVAAPAPAPAVQQHMAAAAAAPPLQQLPALAAPVQRVPTTASVPLYQQQRQPQAPLGGAWPAGGTFQQQPNDPTAAGALPVPPRQQRPTKLQPLRLGQRPRHKPAAAAALPIAPAAPAAAPPPPAQPPGWAGQPAQGRPQQQPLLLPLPPWATVEASAWPAGSAGMPTAVPTQQLPWPGVAGLAQPPQAYQAPSVAWGWGGPAGGGFLHPQHALPPLAGLQQRR